MKDKLNIVIFKNKLIKLNRHNYNINQINTNKHRIKYYISYITSSALDIQHNKCLIHKGARDIEVIAPEK